MWLPRPAARLDMFSLKTRIKGAGWLTHHISFHHSMTICPLPQSEVLHMGGIVNALYQRRRTRNPENPPLAKLQCSPFPLSRPCLPSPTEMNTLEIIGDGFARGVKVVYSSRGHEYSTMAPGKQFHFTRRALPALPVSCVAEKGRFGRLRLQVDQDISTLVEMLVKCSSTVRASL